MNAETVIELVELLQSHDFHDGRALCEAFNLELPDNRYEKYRRVENIETFPQARTGNLPKFE